MAVTSHDHTNWTIEAVHLKALVTLARLGLDHVVHPAERDPKALAAWLALGEVETRLDALAETIDNHRPGARR